MKNVFSKHHFFVRCFFFHLSLLFTLSLHSQSESQSQLDTLSSITDDQKIVEYILKIESTQNLLIRDSILKVAHSIVYELGDKSKTVGVLLAMSVVDWVREDYDEAYLKMREAYDISVKMNDPATTANVLNNMGNYFQRKNKFEKADSIFKLCIDYWGEAADDRRISKGYNNRAIVYLRLGQYPKADSLALLAKKYADITRDRRVQASAMTSQFVIASYEGNNQKAYSICKDMLDTIAPMSEEYGAFYANSLLNFGSVASQLGYYREGIESFIKADSIYRYLDMPNSEISTLENIALLYRELGDFDGSLLYYKKGLQRSLEVENFTDAALMYNSIAQVYVDLEDAEFGLLAQSYTDSAYQIYLEDENKVGMANCHWMYSSISMLRKDSDAALLAIDKAIDLFTETESEILLNSCLFEKALILEERGSSKDAYQIFNKVQLEYLETASDSTNYDYLHGTLLRQLGQFQAAANILDRTYLKNNELRDQVRASEIKEIGDKYQTEKQLVLNEKLKSEQKLTELTVSRQKSMIGYGSLGLGLVSLLSYLLFRQGRKKEQLNKELQTQKSQVLLLNQELNHRVKNNLSFMTALLEMQGRRSENEETRQALQESESRLKALSLVHANLFKNESDTHINLKDYLHEILGHLQDIFGAGEKSLSINSNFIDRVVDAEDAMRIGLILNELVTNSVKHAFAQVDSPRIDVETIKEGDKIVLKYKDNGPGIQKAQIGEDPREQSLGVKLIGILEKQVSEVIRLEVG